MIRNIGDDLLNDGRFLIQHSVTGHQVYRKLFYSIKINDI